MDIHELRRLGQGVKDAREAVWQAQQRGESESTIRLLKEILDQRTAKYNLATTLYQGQALGLYK